MDEKLREKMILAFEKAVRAAGAKDYEEGMNSARKLIGWVHARAESIQNIEDLRATLDSIPPLSKRDEVIGLFIVNHLPQILRIGLKIAARKAASELPAFQAGRPPAIPARKSGEVLDYIAHLHRKGCTLDAAKMRTSLKFGCSLRTIERLWSKRESAEDDLEIIEVTMDEALEYIAAGPENS